MNTAKHHGYAERVISNDTEIDRFTTVYRTGNKKRNGNRQERNHRRNQTTCNQVAQSMSLQLPEFEDKLMYKNKM